MTLDRYCHSGENYTATFFLFHGGLKGGRRGTFDISIGEGRGREGESGAATLSLMGGRRKREVVPPEPTLEKQEEWHLGCSEKEPLNLYFV